MGNSGDARRIVFIKSENAIAKTIYDKNRGYLDNIEQRMVAAGITGTALKGGLEIIGKVRSGKNPQVLAKTQRTFNISKEKVNAKVGGLQNEASQIKSKIQSKLGTNEVGVTNNGQKINVPKKNPLPQNFVFCWMILLERTSRLKRIVYNGEL